MITDLHISIDLFHEFSVQTFSYDFAKLQTTSGKFCDICSTNQLITYQHLLLVVDKNAINTKIKHAV